MSKLTGLTKRITAMLLSGILVIGSVSGSVFAASTDADSGQTSEIAEEMFTEDTSEEPAAAGEMSEIEETFEEPAVAGKQEIADEGTEQAVSVQESEEDYAAEESADAVTSEESLVEEDVVTGFKEDTSDVPADAGNMSQVEDTSEVPEDAWQTVEEALAEEAEEAQYYTITLDANGGYFENEWDDALGDYAQQAEVVEKHIPVDGTVVAFPVFTDQDGQSTVFAGWSLERDGELVSQAEEEYIPVDNCTLYAVWRAEDAALGETGEQEIAEEGTEHADSDSVQEFEEDYAEEETANAVTAEEGAIEEDTASEANTDPETQPEQIESSEEEETVREDAANGVVKSGTCGSNLTWTLDADGTLTISGTGAMKNWTITTYGTSDWKQSDVTSVIIEEGVTSIGNYAFNRCGNLKSVKIANTVRSIGEIAFESCSQLTSVIIPKGVTSIEYRTFNRCESLSSIVLPDTIEQIGESAFGFCGMSELIIPSSVKTIDETAFGNCKNLKELVIPENVTEIGRAIVGGCINLTSITFPEHAMFPNGFSVERCTRLEEVIIPETVTMIAHHGFNGCSNLNRIMIPEKVTSVGNYAFYDCGITEITIPENVNSIGSAAFSNCLRLERIIFLCNRPSIGESAFYNVTADGYYLPDDLSWSNASKDFYGGIIEWHKLGLNMELPESEKVFDYTGEEIHPVPIVKNVFGNILTEGTDYTLTYSDNIEPGTATITATGLGDYAGQTANVTFEIKKEISVDIDESEIIALPNQEILITARIISPNVTDISSNIKWGVSSSDDYEGITGSDSVTKVNERTYNVTHSETFKNTGVFTVSLEFLGVSDEVKIKVVVPDISVEMGPYFNDGSLVYEKISTINSFCDIRLVASFEKKNISEPDLIREYLSNVTYDIRNQDGSENNYVVIYSRKIEIKDDEKEGALILRIGPGKAVVKDSKAEKITFTDQANTVFEKEFQIRDGLLYYLKYRADNQDEEGNKYSYNNEHMFYYSDAFFYKGAATYNNDLAVMTLGLEMSSFSSPFYDHKYGEFTIGTDRAENILDAYTKLHFYPDSPREYNYNIELSNSSDKVAYTIATKYIASQETDDTLITVIVRGGGYGAEWASNFNVGETGDEKGFKTAANYVYDSVEDYIFQLKEEDKLIGDVKLLITGFSRGAAVANLVSHQINSSGVLSGCDIHSTNNYTYTFATPAGHYGKDTSDQNIFNILSENDLVPKIPFEDWGFSRYGKDVVLPESTPEEVKQSFYNYTGIVFNANKEKAFEGWLTDTILKISPDRSSYVNNLQYYITKWEKLQYKDIKGDFVKGLLGGIINAFAEKYSLIDSSGGHLSLDVRSSVNEIKALLGNSIPIGMEVGDSILNCIDALSDEEMVIDLQLVHYPEHYLAWLETGGIYTADKNTYAKYSDEKKTIIGNGISGIIGNALHKPSYKSAVVAGTTNVSVFDSDGNLLVSTVSGIKGNGGAFAFSNSDEQNSFVIIPSDVQISLVVGNGPTGRIDLCIKENTESENVRTLIYEDVVIDEDTSVTVLFDEGFSSVGDSSFVMKNGTAIEPIFDYRSTGDGEALIKSGTCNDSITWELHENGLLNITGTGEIPDYSWNGTGEVSSSTDAPWYQYSSLIKKVVVADGVTSIGDRAFARCDQINSVSIGCNVGIIGEAAFYGCTDLTKMVIPDGVTVIESKAFQDCANLSIVIFRGRIEKIYEGAFTECTYLNDIYYVGTEDDWSKITIEIGNDPLSNARIHYNLDLSDSPVLLEKDSFVFDGTAKKPAVEIVGLKEGQDYTVRYENNTDAGLGVVIVSGLDDFKGEARATFEIIPASIKEALVTGLIGKTYTGKALTQTPVVKIGSTTLEADTDYTVSYNNNTNVGTATVTITGKGNYSGTKTATFKINKATQSITASNMSLTYPSSGKITASGNKGSLSYKSSNTAIATVDSTGKVTAKGAGKATITITAAATSNYNAATKTITVTIAKAAQSITAKAAASSVAVGKTTTVSITGAKGTKSYKSSDTTIATITSAGKVTAKKVGAVKITATSAATSNYNAASKTVTIKVVPAATASLTSANQATGIKLTWKKVTGANGYKVYRGSTLIKTITGGSTVTYADTKANTNGTKYVYKVVAKASTGDSTLSKSRVIYRVSRPAVSSVTNSSSKKMTVKWGKNAKATGYQIQYSTSSSFASGNKTATITGVSTVSKVIGSLIKGKTYYVRIRTYKTVGSTKYWSTWSASKSVKITK